MSISKLVDINCNRKQTKELMEKIIMVKTINYIFKNFVTFLGFLTFNPVEGNMLEEQDFIKNSNC